MRKPRIYHPEVIATPSEFALSEAAAHHVTKVLRLSVGAELIIFDGQGLEYPAELKLIDKRRAWVAVGDACTKMMESPLAIHLVQALTKLEKMDWIIQKAAELGAYSCTPMITERCTVHLDAARWSKRLAHWRAVAISAAEQCGRNCLLEIKAPVDFNDLADYCLSDQRYILVPGGPGFSSESRSKSSLQLFIGPEGGFSDAEEAFALAQGIKPLGLGPRILRTETAALTAIAVCQAWFGDLA